MRPRRACRRGENLKTSAQTVTVHTRRAFAISRGSADAFERVIFEVEEDGLTGRGEAAPTGYYGQDAAGVREALENAEIPDPWDIEGTLARNASLPPTALCALDNAPHDPAPTPRGAHVPTRAG